MSVMFFIFLVGTGYSQWFSSLYLEQEYNSNPFGIPDPEPEQISKISLGLQKDWQKMSIQYYGSYIGYHENRDRSLYWHQLNLGGGESLTWNITAENRLNRQEYGVYDYWLMRAGLAKSTTFQGILWRLGGNFSLNRFLELSELNNLQMTVYSSLNRAFPTRTSLIATLSVHYKYYLETPVNTVTGDTTLYPYASVSGINQGGGMGPGHGGGGMGGGYIFTDSQEHPSVTQGVISLRLAQSIFRYTGLAIQYTGRLNFNQYDRSVAGLVYGYLSESQIFDDYLGYEAQMLGSELTQLLPLQMTARMAFYHQKKYYVAQGIYLDAENFDALILREDRYRTAWISLGKRFNFSESGNMGLLLHVNYQWIRNESNSYWYNYESQFVSVGLQFDI